MNTKKILVGRKPVGAAVPEWIVGWAAPEFEDHGPECIDASELSLFLHPLQQGGRRMRGTDLFDHLRRTDMIAQCLNLQEGRALVAAGSLPPLFKGTHIFLWRSVAYDSSRSLFVPFIQNIAGQPAYIRPIIYWYWLEYRLEPIHGAALFEAHNLLSLC